MTNDVVQYTDDSTGEIVQITQEMRDRAVIVDANLKKSMLESYIALSEMVDDKLYLALGYTTAREYFASIGTSDRMAYLSAQIGREFRQALGSGEKSVKSISHSVANLGVLKLRQIIQAGSEKFQQLVADGSIVIEDRELSVDEISRRSANDLKDELKKLREKSQEADELQMQLKIKQRELDSTMSDLQDLKKYEPIREKVSAFRESYSKLNKQAEDMMLNLNRIEADQLLPENQAELVKFLNGFYDLMELYRQRYSELFITY